jgi:chromosome segregation ATPase
MAEGDPRQFPEVLMERYRQWLEQAQNSQEMFSDYFRRWAGAQQEWATSMNAASGGRSQADLSASLESVLEHWWQAPAAWSERIEQEVKTVRDRLEAGWAESAARAESDLQALREAMRAQTDQLKSSLQGSAEAPADLAARLESLEKRLDRLDARIGELLEREPGAEAAEEQATLLAAVEVRLAAMEGTLRANLPPGGKTQRKKKARKA